MPSTCQMFMLLIKNKISIASRPHNLGKVTSILQAKSLDSFNRISDMTDLTGGSMKNRFKLGKELGNSFTNPNENESELV